MFIFGMQANGLNLKFKLLTLIEIDIQSDIFLHFNLYIPVFI